eukprot:CAMPEP_0202465256 /NCGR_PEP_ID=MMETSP1360-20130828/65017_1 /ASSEMBLY_ACC=CAM_ASM_000848 /TAXON_ID=515479 /ORGANISM="Licmophora paradoxa, Strain CCMP2313" /LENGTH=273 /DNA_ID=CAMNT_0049088929 /DNA_START=75 /DNA_END=893 /DNA_ORIENTATION=+
MVPDPYKALGLGHDASSNQIKSAYRKLALQYHPDRLAARAATKEEWRVASENFAAISAAYALLSDDRRKREYDHIYKYGGYDEIPQNQKTRSRSRQPYHQTPYHEQVEDPFNPFPKTAGSKKDRRQKGVGYAISDPISYMFNKSATGGKKAVAGIHIPPRMQMVHQAPQGGGFRFSFSQGEFSTNKKTGVKKFVSRTTQIVQGKKYTKFETTTVHPDGRREIVIEGNDFVERRSLPPPRRKKKKSSSQQEEDEEMVDGEGPWYMNAWSNVRDR